jgi:diguanylate cyclase (GGDEF)-like protein
MIFGCRQRENVLRSVAANRQAVGKYHAVLYEKRAVRSRGESRYQWTEFLLLLRSIERNYASLAKGYYCLKEPHVAALDFVAAPRQRYRYKLEGLDPDWTIAGASQRSITYSRVPPGGYVLRVAATSRDGRWSDRALQLPITVRPAFHQTTWFRLLAALAFLALLYGIYRLRVRQLRAREQELETLVTERTSELANAYARIEEASLTDPLTGLRNRRYLEQTMDADLELAARGEGDLVALLVDLDHFKNVNDTYGHAAGDAVLAELARVLRQTMRASDVIVRWGGEEFLIVVRFVGRALAPELAEKVRAAVAAHEFPLPDGTLLRRTCSIGAATWPFSRTDLRAIAWEHIVDLADLGLYAAKRSGRDAWVAVSSGSGDPATAVELFRSDPAAAVVPALGGGDSIGSGA